MSTHPSVTAETNPLRNPDAWEHTPTGLWSLQFGDLYHHHEQLDDFDERFDMWVWVSLGVVSDDGEGVRCMALCNEKQDGYWPQFGTVTYSDDESDDICLLTPKERSAK